MRSRLLMSFALLAAIFAAAFSATAPARALSCDPCPAVTTSALNLRTAPSLNAEILLVIPNGAEVEYDNSVSRQNGYLAVSYNGVEGYAHSLYLLLFPTTASTSDWLNLRSGPSITSSVILVMPPGSLVQVRSKAQNGYYAVAFDQRVRGYAHGDYRTFEHTGAFSKGEGVFVQTDALNLRSSASASSSVRAVLLSGHRMIITGGPVERDGYSWYRVNAGTSGSGWVAGEFLARR
ncbi:MAG TPA: SH3 domain-containing protein [Thermomicrobiales bacterium]|nr:SH3 domain-containing protein [Thermomicrobiales bacterium]